MEVFKKEYIKIVKGNNSNNKYIGGIIMKQSDNKVITFLKKNSAYLVLALCVLAVGLSTAIVLVNNAKKQNSLQSEVPDDKYTLPVEDVTDVENPLPNEPENNAPVVSVITFSMPILEPISIEEYSDVLVWNGTLGRYSSHKAIDFFAEEGSSVCAVYDGTVEEITNDILKGVTLVIDHGNGLKTVYNSIEEIDGVTVGKTVKKGEVIGRVSVSNRQEASSGAHLHFEVMEDGEVIDPVKYLSINEK